jgi:V-type H+-transporting ATPase subunit a
VRESVLGRRESDPDTNKHYAIPGNVEDAGRLYDGQETVQLAVLIVFMSSIPLMFIVKPIVEMIVHAIGNEFLEVFVITFIEVIEFTLNVLSHTVSDLRLWAVSLPHSQLSHVLSEKIFVMTIDSGNCGLMFVGFAGWTGGSVAILFGRECFSSLFHGSLLMWVEFWSMFYSGTGMSSYHSPSSGSSPLSRRTSE